MWCGVSCGACVCGVGAGALPFETTFGSPKQSMKTTQPAFKAIEVSAIAYINKMKEAETAASGFFGAVDKLVSNFTKARPNPSKSSSQRTADLHQPPLRATAAV